MLLNPYWDLTYRAKLTNLMLFLGLHMFTEDMTKQRALTAVRVKFIWLYCVLGPVSWRLPRKCECVSCGPKCQ